MSWDGDSDSEETALTAPIDTRSDPDRTARAITGRSDEAVRAPTAELRQGVVQAVNVPAARVDVTLGGDSTSIPGVAHLSNYRPTVNDTCWVLVNGPDLLVLDRTAALGPSVVSTAAAGTVLGTETRTSTTPGDLATVGPALTCSVSPSGRLLVQLSAWCENLESGSAGAGMSCALTGANTVGTSSEEELVSYIGTGNALIAASKVNLYTGLNPGQTTVTAKYRAVQGGEAAFRNRHVWVLPL